VNSPSGQAGPDSTSAGEEQAAVGRHRGLAAGGVVGQDRHHVAPDGSELVAVVHPAGAVHLAQAIERPAHLVLCVDHVAAGAQRLGLGDLTARAVTAAVLASRPVCSSKVATSTAAAASPIAICTTSDWAIRVTPRDTRPASAAQAMSRARRPSAMATGGSE